ncbi:MAG: glycosyltransferase [Chloroherpetonaceae bacterium]|nr:glycosyltransferase [Chloroherpetonaceae bacterium]MCS7210760.1 glycosyltransferase [Chloroherpetonaceae bacterium]MDW8019504.1 glycosyltransferase [Chloroherpetonaceae bacterium]MDW8466439.1 glycosyltransferase [Chloroherpetonaceae bacterium]
MTETFFWITATLLVLYALQKLVITAGLFRLPKRRQWDTLPMVTVVVAARNEEKNIARTLDSLVQLDYPKEKLEIIVSDGASTDRTCEIVSQYAARYSFITLHHADQNQPIRGKANAIHQAVLRARGEFIMMTDADCTVQPTWIRHTLSYFTDDVGLVCGITIPRPTDAFATIQMLDWCYILGVSSGRASIGFPIGGIGNNFNFRKTTYHEIGGYAKLRFSVTEDFALFQAILRSRWKIVFPILYETHNQTEPMPTFSELYEQKKRWSLGGLDASLVHAFLAGFMFFAHLFPVLAFFILPLTTALALLGLKLLSDALLLLPVLVRLRQVRTLWAFPLFELYYFLFVFAAPLILSLSRNVVWKGIDYNLLELRRS